MPYDKVDLNVSVAKTIYYSAVSLRSQSPARRKQVAGYLRGIAMTINAAVAELSAGQPAHGKCGEMLGHASLLVGEIGDLIGIDKARMLEAKLREAYDVETFLQIYQQPAERADRFGQLAFAAGFYNAAAAAVEAGDAEDAAQAAPVISAQAQALHTALDQYFKLAELEQLCFDLNIDWENLRGEIKTDKARALVLHCERRGNLRALRALVIDARPEISL
jgi:hypothetical protein